MNHVPLYAKAALDILPQFGVPIMDTVFHHRTAYRQSAAFGGTVHDLGSKAEDAITEVEALADEVLNLVKERMAVA